MAFTDLREFIAAIERKGWLTRVKAPVDPALEITEITDRLSKSTTHPAGPGGPALLFESVKGSTMPVAINLFGTKPRMELALGQCPAEVAHVAHHEPADHGVVGAVRRREGFGPRLHGADVPAGRHAGGLRAGPLQHRRRDVQRLDETRRGDDRGGQQSQVAGAGAQVEDPPAGAQHRRGDRPPAPALVEPETREPVEPVIAGAERVEEGADVGGLISAGRGGHGGAG